jgi:hypothetical protein
MFKIAILILSLSQGRYYWPVTISTIVHGLNKHTHVSVTAKPFKTIHELDGDTHIWIRDSISRDSMVVECIPKLPCPNIIIGKLYNWQGITRFDGEHRWYEIHPLEQAILK